jgi:hypothetical protein
LIKIATVVKNLVVNTSAANHGRLTIKRGGEAATNAGKAALRSQHFDLYCLQPEPQGKGNHFTTAIMPGSMSLFTVNAVLIMSTEDNSRIYTKYFSPPHPPAGVSATADYPGANPYHSVKEQKAFEAGLMEKTNKQTNDVILYDNRVVVFKVESDVMLYVIGSADENEVLLYNVVLSLRDALGILFKCVKKKTLCEMNQSANRKVLQRSHGQAHNH